MSATQLRRSARIAAHRSKAPLVNFNVPESPLMLPPPTVKSSVEMYQELEKYKSSLQTTQKAIVELFAKERELTWDMMKKLRVIQEKLTFLQMRDQPFDFGYKEMFQQNDKQIAEFHRLREEFNQNILQTLGHAAKDNQYMDGIMGYKK